ncbi:hypothetical protein ACVRZ8_01370 [Streptococcus dentiloxodontae]
MMMSNFWIGGILFALGILGFYFLHPKLNQAFAHIFNLRIILTEHDMPIFVKKKKQTAKGTALFGGCHT